MNRTHTSYKVSRMLKEFLGESAPEPMDKYSVWIEGWSKPTTDTANNYAVKYPAYQLHDLLSKPFCEAMFKALDRDSHSMAREVHCDVTWAYWDGGMKAVEKALTEMMEGK